MRPLLLLLSLLGCSPSSGPFQLPERHEARSLPADPMLKPGRGFDPVSGEPRASCFPLRVLTPTFISGSGRFANFEPGAPAQLKLRGLLADLGHDGDLVARATAAEVEAALAAGATGIRVRTSDSWVERRVLLGLCESPFATARQYLDHCGAGYVESEGYRKVGVWLESLPKSEGAPVHFVMWGAPAPTAATDTEVDRSLAVGSADQSDLTNDLPPTEGTRRLARMSGWPAHKVAFCIAMPVIGASCLERLVTETSAMRCNRSGVGLRAQSVHATSGG